MTGHLTKRGKNSWSIKLELGKDPATGKRRQKWITVNGTRKDAERELARRLHEINTGGFVAPAKMTVSEFFDSWLSTYAVGNVAATTLQGYQSMIERHLKPALGALPLPKLSPLHLQSYYSQLMKAGSRKDGRTGALSAQTVLHHHRLVSEALKMAVRWQLIARNPAEAVEPPKVRPREVTIIDENKTAWLLMAAEGTRVYLPILLAVCAGLRRGEILALRWADLNTENATLSVCRSVIETKAGIGFKEPKGKRGRVVAVPEILMGVLAEHRAEQERIKALLGDGYSDSGLICCTPTGDLWKPSAFTSSYRALLSRRKLTGPNFHALRHSHASHLIKSGVDIKQVSARLGHAKAGFTLNTYVHLMPGQDEEAARRVDVALRKALEETRSQRVM
jgi:integrase